MTTKELQEAMREEHKLAQALAIWLQSQCQDIHPGVAVGAMFRVISAMVVKAADSEADATTGFTACMLDFAAIFTNLLAHRWPKASAGGSAST